KYPRSLIRSEVVSSTLSIQDTMYQKVNSDMQNRVVSGLDSLVNNFNSIDATIENAVGNGNWITVEAYKNIKVIKGKGNLDEVVSKLVSLVGKDAVNVVGDNNGYTIEVTNP